MEEDVIITTDVALSGRIYHPTNPIQDAVAIITHPYGFLGGTQHDHLVVSLARRFAQLGITSLTYDSRGYGKSQGRATWRGQQERQDCERVIEWFVAREKATRIFTCVSHHPRRRE